jgi:hypothetical protein
VDATARPPGPGSWCEGRSVTTATTRLEQAHAGPPPAPVRGCADGARRGAAGQRRGRSCCSSSRPGRPCCRPRRRRCRPCRGRRPRGALRRRACSAPAGDGPPAWATAAGCSGWDGWPSTPS